MPKQTKNAGKLLKSSLVILAICLSSCATRTLAIGKKAPKLETCIIGEFSGQCYDDRNPSGEKEFDLTFEEMENYIAHPPMDYQTLKEWCERRIDGN